MKTLYLTVDVEEDFPPYLTNSFTGIERGIPLLLKFLKGRGIFSTFFVTGEIAQRFPNMVKAILKDRHEIGCHSFRHKPLTSFQLQNEAKQRSEIERATGVLEDLAGIRPTLFRGPEFSVNSNTFKILEELGYRLDSSVLPGRKKRRIFLTICNHVGAPDCPYHPSISNYKVGDGLKLLEVPVTRNPLTKGAPFGLGTINALGAKKSKEIVNNIKQDRIIFVVHSWELCQLTQKWIWRPPLHVRPIRSQDISSSDSLVELDAFLNISNFEFSTMSDFIR